MSSLDFPPTPLQQNHFNVFGTSPDKGNPPNGLYYHQQHQQHSLSKINSLEDRAVSPQSRSDSPIPTALLDRRESDDSVTIHDHQQQQHQDKKSKTKSANRMTLWGKKVFGNQQRTLSSPTSPDIISPLTTAGGLSLNTPSSSSSSTGGNPTPPSSSSSSSSTQHQQPTQQSTHHQDQQQQHRAGMQKSLRHILSRPTQHTDGDETHHNDSKPTHNKPLMPTLSKSSPSAPAPIANKLVFGVPLEEAVRISRVSEGYPLPFIVYRCIEYLDAKNAVLEEGLYRLSGSNTMLQKLKKKFNQGKEERHVRVGHFGLMGICLPGLDGDVPLLQAKEDYDVHVIAGLLKMWLRELPVTVLTRELRPEFIQVIGTLPTLPHCQTDSELSSLL
jgi:RalA-binding protein 1